MGRDPPGSCSQRAAQSHMVRAEWNQSAPVLPLAEENPGIYSGTASGIWTVRAGWPDQGGKQPNDIIPSYTAILVPCCVYTDDQSNSQGSPPFNPGLSNPDCFIAVRRYSHTRVPPAATSRYQRSRRAECRAQGLPGSPRPLYGHGDGAPGPDRIKPGSFPGDPKPGTKRRPGGAAGSRDGAGMHTSGMEKSRDFFSILR